MTLHLYKGPNSWIIRYPAHSREALIMGTTDIPTPFLPSMSVVEVLLKLERLNPSDTFTTQDE
jgi:hypothetical protein